MEFFLKINGIFISLHGKFSYNSQISFWPASNSNQSLIILVNYDLRDLGVIAIATGIFNPDRNIPANVMPWNIILCWSLIRSFTFPGVRVGCM